MNEKVYKTLEYNKIIDKLEAHAFSAEAKKRWPKADVHLLDKIHDGAVWADQGIIAGCAGGGFVAIGRNDVEEGISRYLAGQVFKIKVFRNKKPGLNKTFGCAAHEGLECGAVGAAHHCHAPPTPLGFKRGGERGEIQNGLHKNKGGNKSLAKIVRQNILSKKNCAFL